MLRLSVSFLLVAILSGVLGYSGVAGAASNTAKLLFFFFLILLFGSLVRGSLSGRHQH
jgi:uncharacterized membrane protein YtjA (UPF0391 family)